eukprot:TRINITY_DN1157_c3_g1_i1.p1 TRINITY_DN1157_c3_g1~~TRINITY_DN1157_c3_g1_i1.p1  ORF type:complete len:170 (+),score=32.25 TRINITY_DN1157_c3_g1_i1:152-661(+)
MVEQAAASDDFSFPTIADQDSLCKLRLPGLWFVTSTVSEYCDGDAEKLPEDGGSAIKQRRLPLIEGSVNSNDIQRETELSDNGTNSVIKDNKCLEEERMDMLWEDFNDELERSKAIGSESDTGSPQMAELCCVQALKMSKSSSMLPHRRQSLLVVLKVLKKLFLLHNSH